MVSKRLQFNEIEVPIVKGHEKVIDKDATTEYLFINAPRDIYTVYFDSSMPIFGKNVFDGCEESSSLELNMQDRKICFYCPTRTKGQKMPCGISISCLQVKTVSLYFCRDKTW